MCLMLVFDWCVAEGFSSFLETVEGRGTGAMELVAIHLKQQGAFCSRMLSFEGCSFDITEATLTADMEATYNQARGEAGGGGDGRAGGGALAWCADLPACLLGGVAVLPACLQCAGIWQRLTAEMAIKLKDGGGASSSARGGMDDGLDLDMAVEDEGEEKRGGGGGGAKDLWRYFWATHQRFFRELCVAYKVPVAVALARQALQEGKCVVVGLQSTGEARVKQMARDKGMQVRRGRPVGGGCMWHGNGRGVVEVAMTVVVLTVVLLMVLWSAQGLQDCMDVPKVTLDLMVRKLFNRRLPHHQPATHLQHDQPQAASSTRKGSAGRSDRPRWVMHCWCRSVEIDSSRSGRQSLTVNRLWCILRAVCLPQARGRARRRPPRSRSGGGGGAASGAMRAKKRRRKKKRSTWGRRTRRRRSRGG